MAAVQPKILHPRGCIDSTGCLTDILGHGFYIGKFEKNNDQYDVVRDILYPTFTCVMVRRGVYLKLSGLDPRYFLYNEDLDFGLRRWLAGYRVVYVPNAVAYHMGQHATKKVPYHAIYFGRRNRLFTLFVCYPLIPAIVSSSILLVLYLGAAVTSLLMHGDKVESRITLRVIRSFFRHLRYLTRRRFSARRVAVKDVYGFIERGLITMRLVDLRLYLHKLYRYALGI